MNPALGPRAAVGLKVHTAPRAAATPLRRPRSRGAGTQELATGPRTPPGIQLPPGSHTTTGCPLARTDSEISECGVHGGEKKDA
jgi:hypothetical protein